MDITGGAPPFQDHLALLLVKVLDALDCLSEKRKVRAIKFRGL
jgi:hypothetical protein